MSEHENDEVLEEVIGISDADLRIYSLILTLGNVTKGDLSLMSGTDLISIDETLARLDEHKLVVVLPGIVPRYQAVPPFDKLAEEIGSITGRIEQLRKSLKEELRTASMTVRDALSDLAKENLSNVQQIERTIDTGKTDSTGQLDNLLDSLKTSSQSSVEETSTSLKSSYDTWREDTVGKVESSLSQVTERAESLGASTTTEIRSWGATAREHSEKLRANLVTQVENFSDKSAAGLRLKSDEGIDAVGVHIDSFKSAMGETVNTLKENIESLGNESTQITRSLSSMISTHVAETQESVEQSIQGAMGEIGQNIDNLSNSINSIVSEALVAEDERVTRFESSIENITSRFKEGSMNNIGTFRGSVDSTLDQFLQSGEATVSSMGEQIEGFVNRAATNMTSSQQSMSSASASAIQNMFTKSSEVVEDFVSSTRLTLSNTKTEFHSGIEKIGDSLRELNQNTQSGSTSLLNQTRSSLHQQLDNISTDAREKIDSMLEEVRTSVTGEIDRVISTAKSNIEMEISSRLEQIGSRHGELASIIDTEITEQVTMHDTTIDQLSSTVVSSQSTLIDRIDGVKREATSTLDTQLEELSESTSNIISQMGTESKGLIDGLATGLRDSVESVRSQSHTASSELTRLSTSTAESLQAAANETSSGSRAQASEIRENIRTTLATEVEQGGERVKSSLTSAGQLLNDKMTEIKDSAVSDIDSVGTQGRSRFTVVSEKVDAALVETQTNVDSIKDTLQSELTSTVEDISGMVTSQAAELKGRVEETTGAFRSQIDAETETRVTDIETQVSAAKSEIERISATLIGDTVRSVEGFQSKAMETVKSNNESMLSSLNVVITETREKSTGIYDGLKTTSGTLKTSLNRLVSKLDESPMLGLTEGTLDEAFAAEETGGVPGADIATRLSRVWERVGATDFPGAKQTWTIVTRKAVQAHITDMLQRAKSKVTLIYPNPMEVPTDVLTQLKSAVGVELVITEGNLERVKPLIGRGNIRVRTRSEKDVYACVRDSEEVLLAPAAPMDQDVVGVTTEEDGFIRFIMSIIGPIFQAKTKLLRPGDA